ncbi:hypothetical protein HDV02_006567 [Globomyces sp. JEL0801]|nr:hypothetical protein HDV02_006567 [Globomyces sp. JEL0801]
MLQQAFIRRQFKVESPELFFLVVNVAFQISFSLKGFFHAIGIYYIHGLKKRERRIAKPTNNVTESLEMTETIDDTDDTDVSEDSMVNHLSMMGVIVPLHVKIGLKRNRSKGMKAKQSEHFESTFDESGTVDDDGSLVLNESYIVTHRSPDYTLDESSVLPQTTK